jgi:hypothetical protein
MMSDQEPSTKRAKPSLPELSSSDASSASSWPSQALIAPYNYTPSFPHSLFIPIDQLERLLYELIPVFPMDLCKLVASYKQFRGFCTFLVPCCIYSFPLYACHPHILDVCVLIDLETGTS